MSLPASATPVEILDTAQTYGWDSVFAMHICDVNDAIKKAGSSPTTFSAVDDQDGFFVDGTFGAWQITTDGSGDIVCLAIPIVSAAITNPDKSVVTVSGTAVVEVRLNFLHQEEAEIAAGTQHVLKVQTSAPGPELDVATVTRIDYTSGDPPFLEKAALEAMLGLWLNENIVDFDHVFATVNLDRKAATGAFQWMQPTDIAYAYADIGTPGDGILGILCMTEGRSSEKLIQQISSSAIPKGQRAAFLISKERVLEKLMLPAMPHVFAGATPADFVMSDSGDAIKNANANINFTVTNDGKEYQARIVDLSVTIVAAEMQFAVKTITALSSEVDAYCQSRNFLGIQLVNKLDHGQTLNYYNIRPAEENHWTDNKLANTEWWLNIFAIVAGAILTIVSLGSAVGIAALIVILVAGGMTLATTIIQDVGKNNAPAIDALVLDSTAAIEWSDPKDFLITSASLNDSLQLGGNPHFS